MRICTLILVAMAALLSCNKDEDTLNFPQPSKSQLLLGKWQLISITHLDTITSRQYTINGVPEDYMHFTKDSLDAYVRSSHQYSKYQLFENDSLRLTYDPRQSSVASEMVHISYVTANQMEIRGHIRGEEIGIIKLKK